MSSSPLVRNVGFLMPSPNQKVQTPNNNNQSKQRQSTLKQHVQQFGDLLVVWRESSMTMSSLLQSLSSLLRTMQSISKVIQNPGTFLHVMLKMKGFADIDIRITEKLLVDIEVIWMQLKSLQ